MFAIELVEIDRWLRFAHASEDFVTGCISAESMIAAFARWHLKLVSSTIEISQNHRNLDTATAAPTPSAASRRMLNIQWEIRLYIVFMTFLHVFAFLFASSRAQSRSWALENWLMVTSETFFFPLRSFSWEKSFGDVYWITVKCNAFATSHWSINRVFNGGRLTG